MNSKLKQALQELEQHSEAYYLEMRKHLQDGAQWDKGFLEGVKATIKIVEENSE